MNYQAHAAARMAQLAVRELAHQLRWIEQRMADICATLPEPGHLFDPLAEIRDALHCVQGELIADARQTLELLAKRTAAELRRDFDRRQRLLAAPRRLD